VSERTNGVVEERAAQQRARALAKANRVRMARAAIRRRLKAGEIDLEAALELAPASTPVFELVAALPVAPRERRPGTPVRKARALAESVLERADFDHGATVAELSDAERTLLLWALPNRHRPAGLEPLGDLAIGGVRGLREGLRAGSAEETEEALRSVVRALRFYAEGGEGSERARAALRELGGLGGRGGVKRHGK
jgi:hypothetical protein